MEENQILDSSSGALDGGADVSEKKFSRDQVAKIVNAEANKAAERAKAEAESKHQGELRQLQADRERSSPSALPDKEALFREFSDRFHKDNHQRDVETYLQNVGKSFHAKMQQGREHYADFDEVIKDFDPAVHPELTVLMADRDDAIHLMHDLINNPLKLSGISGLAKSDPRLAQRGLASLSKSISENRKALDESGTKKVPEPLDRLQASKVSGSNGPTSVSEMRKHPAYRG